MQELIVVVEEAAEGGYTAHGLNAPIFTEADTLAELHDQVRDAVCCHFEPGQAPSVVGIDSFFNTGDSNEGSSLSIVRNCCVWRSESYSAQF